MLYKECQEEAIHLCGQIQPFGYLFVFDHHICVASGENSETLLDIPLDALLGKSLMDILELLSGAVSWNLEDISQKINDEIFLRYVERISIKGVAYFLSIYRYDQKIYVELEMANQHNIKTTNLFYYAKYLEEKGDEVWQSLTVLIRQIIGYDRVMVYRFQEDNSGQVIAESTAPGMSSLMGYRYPEFDIPKQARELYTTFLARHVADTDTQAVLLKGLQPHELDLTRCSVRALSPIHLEYLRNAGARASASFSILLDGKLWGIVACQHRLPLHVDLAQRHLSIFLTQYAVNYYLTETQKQDILAQKMTSALEQELKAELLLNSNTVFVLERFAQQIMEATNADGLILKHERGCRSWGEVPDEKSRKAIDRFLAQQEQDEFFYTSAYMQEEDSSEASIHFPGVLRVNIMPHSQLKLYLFRKEHIYEEVWAGKPEKLFNQDTESKMFLPSPRKSFEAWHEIMKGQSLKWKKHELSYIKKLVRIIQRSVAQRGGEIEQLNRELIRSNNALETFSYTLTHDLKNPLSAIKLAGQMIQKENIPKEMLSKLASNIIEASGVIEDMLEKVYELNKASQVVLKKELIDPRAKILSILESSKQQYGSDHLTFEVGETYPVKGDKTLMYQLFLNLIGNAVKYSSKKAAPKVEVYSEKEGHSVIYYVKDNGIGMDLQNGGNIFDIFKRLPNTDGFEGSGIGLSIVKRITDQLNAQVMVSSQLEVGTTFSVTFKDMN